VATTQEDELLEHYKELDEANDEEMLEIIGRLEE
jgi:hypothetical protein